MSITLEIMDLRKPLLAFLGQQIDKMDISDMPVAETKEDGPFVSALLKQTCWLLDFCRNPSNDIGSMQYGLTLSEWDEIRQNDEFNAAVMAMIHERIAR